MKNKLFYFGLSGIINAGKTSILRSILNKKQVLLESINKHVFKCNKTYDEIEDLLNISFEQKSLVSNILSLQLSPQDKQKLMNDYYKSFDELSISKTINISDQSIGATIAYNYINKDLTDINQQELYSINSDFKNDVKKYLMSFENLISKHEVFLQIHRIHRDKNATLKHTTSEEKTYFGDLDTLKSLELNLKLLSETLRDSQMFKKVIISDHYLYNDNIENIADKIIISITNLLIKYYN